MTLALFTQNTPDRAVTAPQTLGECSESAGSPEELGAAVIDAVVLIEEEYQTGGLDLKNLLADSGAPAGVGDTQGQQSGREGKALLEYVPDAPERRAGGARLAII